MATRAHSTPASASRRPPLPAAVPPLAADRRPQPAATSAALPSPAALLALLPGMWDEHHAHDLAALRAIRLKDEAAHAAADTAKDRCWGRIKATQDMILSSQSTTLADAAAILLITHHEVENWTANDGSDRMHGAVEMLLHQAVAAIGFVARAGGMDLSEGGKNYLTEGQAMIVRGEVVA